VTLALVNGRGEHSEFVFDERSTCLIGRGEDCSPRLPNDEHHRSVSRHHCMLDINPPDVCIRDFGSRNGTYVNGVKIGQRDPAQSAEQGRGLGLQERDLKDGDEVRLGRSVAFRVSVKLPPEAATTIVLGAHLAETLLPPGCVKCGRETTRELGIRGAAATGQYVCESCQANPEDVMTLLVKLAQAGTRSDLNAIAEYTLLGELGRGGMGAVYLARHKTTAQHVALKLMLPKVAANETARARFMREVELTRMLRHPNVAALYEDGFADGAFFFTTEYCEGGSLDRLLRIRGGKLPIDEAVKYALDVLDGLEYAHSRNVVHRDLSPSNILLADATTASSSSSARTVPGPSNRAGIDAINADADIDGNARYAAPPSNRAHLSDDAHTRAHMAHMAHMSNQAHFRDGAHAVPSTGPGPDNRADGNARIVANNRASTNGIAHPSNGSVAGIAHAAHAIASPNDEADAPAGAVTNSGARANARASADADPAARPGTGPGSSPSANALRRYGATTPYIAKVGDFGLGKAFDQAGLSGLTRTGAKAGKPWYLARQQVVNFKQVPKAVDIWALAACLYKCLTGTYVRDFPDDVDQWHVILYSSPVPIRERDRSIPPALAEVIDEALREQPEIGFSTAAAFRDALRQAWPIG
jgi:eukaryotic-like serine/threonine-protein kinase